MSQAQRVHSREVSSYVSREGDAYRVANSRVSLDSVVYGFLRGETAETIAQNFPLLSLEQVYGAITFYLANRDEIDAYLRQGEADFEGLRHDFELRNPGLREKLFAAKRRRLQHA
jgi:uncharacterized protein (DUF433 family)